MYPSLSALYQDEAWRELAADIDDFVGELVEIGGTHEPHRDLRLRLVRLKIGNLKLRLRKLKRNLQSYLEGVEEQLPLNSSDREARKIQALGADRLADMWLMEGMLKRLGNLPTKKTPGSVSIPQRLPSIRSSEAGEAV